jgi:hypothetical protein
LPLNQNGTRRYTLTPQAESNVEFMPREEFSGLLPPIGRSVPDMAQTFQEFVAGLKAFTEQA